MKQLSIDGKFIAPLGGETIGVVSPVDGKEVEAIARGREQDIDRVDADRIPYTLA